MKLKIDISNTFDLVQDQLGMIGKRVKTQTGEPMFSDFSLSSREKPVILQYAVDAVQAIIAIAPERVTDYHKENGCILFSVNGGRDNDNLTEMFNDMASAFVRTYCIAQFLAMTKPDYAKKYFDEANSISETLFKLLFNKANSLTSSDSLALTKGSVIIN